MSAIASILNPKKPKPAVIKQEAPPAKTNTSVQDSVNKERQRLAGAFGRNSTIKTSTRGVVGEPLTGTKLLLGDSS